MYYEYPLEALARRRGALNQLDFALEARLALPNTDEAVFKPLPRGLAILAANEEALARPTRVLRDLYGDFVEVREPKVRRMPGTPAREPIMQVRITAPRQHARSLSRELYKRGAAVLDEDMGERVFVVRAEAPLESLLGLPSRLDELTGGQAMHSIRLVRYDTVEEIPDGDGPRAA